MTSKRPPVPAPPARDFAGALRADGLAVIAEIKRRSPSTGPHRSRPGAIEPGQLPTQQGGAAAVSVLTEPDHFAGSLDDLRDGQGGRRAPGAPQGLHAASGPGVGEQGSGRRCGAADRGHPRRPGAGPPPRDRRTRRAWPPWWRPTPPKRPSGRWTAGAPIVGRQQPGPGHVRGRSGDGRARCARGWATWSTVAESGVSDAEGAARMAAAGYDAILVGEAAVRASDPAVFIASCGRAR